MNTVDLNTCVPGQKLRSRHGEILTYVKKLDPERDYYDHMVKYANGSGGTRTNDGFVYRNADKRLASDHDIVEILPVNPKFKVGDEVFVIDNPAWGLRPMVVSQIFDSSVGCKHPDFSGQGAFDNKSLEFSTLKRHNEVARIRVMQSCINELIQESFGKQS